MGRKKKICVEVGSAEENNIEVKRFIKKIFD